MMSKLVTIIMSTYNETEVELRESINSVLNQTYTNFEYIIVNDNPKNANLARVLNQLSDKRIKIIQNKNNKGLVWSLNRALKRAVGDIIVRMDADDICINNRIERQLEYLNDNRLDLIGSYVELIDEKGCSIKKLMKLPQTHKEIAFYMKWGNCIVHPTWMGKREVFVKLDGYIKAIHCEDYDFILRALRAGFKVGNVPEKLLKYRIRHESISRENIVQQYILRLYLSNNIKTILYENNLREKDILNYVNSDKFREECDAYKRYRQCKKALISHNNIFEQLPNMITSKFLYLDIIEKLTLFMREH